jgi:peptidoglycan/LPS O-acetylase OafA/YrhL
VSMAYKNEKGGGFLSFNRFSTIGEKYASAGFRPTGFDYLRIILAVSIVLFHAILLCHDETWKNFIIDTEWKLPLEFLLPSFFALSGFLIVSSLERSTIRGFIGLRAIRIVPALAVDTFLKILIVGPLFTVLPLRLYFSSKETWTYLLNIVGRIHYRLPGVFLHNPTPENLNGQLWTIPWEFSCYAIILLLAIIGILRSRTWFLALAIVAPILVLSILTQRYPALFAPSERFIAPSTIDLVLSFLAGVAIYKYREFIPHSPIIAVSAVISYAVSANTQYSSVFTGPFVAYITVWIGVTNYRRTFLIRSGDYTYGIYVYHSVLQQVIVSLGILTWYAVFGMSLALVVALASMSWHLVEKPALSLRKYLRKDPSLSTGSATVSSDF